MCLSVANEVITSLNSAARPVGVPRISRQAQGPAFSEMTLWYLVNHLTVVTVGQVVAGGRNADDTGAGRDMPDPERGASPRLVLTHHADRAP